MIDEVTFGPWDAYQDTNLSEYFVDNKVYQDLIDKKGSIVVGRKGSGKTAIFKKLSNAENQDKYTILDFKVGDSYKGPQLQESYTDICNNIKYELLIALSRKILEHKNLYPKNPLTELEALLRDYGEVVKSFLKGITSVGTPFLSFTRSELRKTKAFFEKERIDRFTAPLSKCLKIKSGLILFDDPDTIFTDPENPDHKIIEGLLFAARDLSMLYGKDLRVIVFLKSSIYDYIDYNFVDMDKIKDYIINISWENEELERLIANRIKFSLKLTDNKRPWEYWNLAFEGNDKKGTQKIQNYLFERLVNGPRDLIAFCTKAREQALKIGNDKIMFKDLENAESIYSQDMLKVINREYGNKYKDIQLFIERVFGGQKFSFSKDELKNHLDTEWRNEFKLFEKQDWFTSSTPKGLMELLYMIGFIGYKEKSSHRIIYSYQKQNIGEFLDADEYNIPKAYHKSLI